MESQQPVFAAAADPIQQQPQRPNRKTWYIFIAILVLIILILCWFLFFRNDESGVNITQSDKNLISTENDSDGDSLSDVDETKYGTDPHNSDTDGDAFNDGEEVAKSFDPLGPGSALTFTAAEACRDKAFLFSPDNAIAGNSDEFDQVNIEIILDGSGSMSGDAGGQTKIAAAKQIISKIVDRLPDKKNLNVGFRAYGFQSASSEKNCHDTKLLVPIQGVNKQALKNAANSITPTGLTPIANSLEEAAKDFSNKEGNYNSIILISDGQETCDRKPENVAKEIYQKTGLKINTHVVGFGIENADEASLQKIADNAGGTYNTAKNANELESTLNTVVEKIISGGRLHVVYRDSNNKPFTDQRRIVLNPMPKDISIFDTYLDDNGEVTLPLEPGDYSFKIASVSIQTTDVANPAEYRAVVKKGFQTNAEISLGKIQVVFPKAPDGEQPTLLGGDYMTLRNVCSEKQENVISVLSKNWPINFNTINANIVEADVYPGVYRLEIKGPRTQKLLAISSRKTTTVDYTNFFGIVHLTKPIFNLEFPNTTQQVNSTYVFPCCGQTKFSNKRGSYYSPGREYFSVYALPGTYELTPMISTDTTHGYKFNVTVERGKTTEVDPQPSR